MRYAIAAVLTLTVLVSADMAAGQSAGDPMLAKAKAIIAAANAEAHFVPLDLKEEVVVQHRGSGLRCHFGVGGSGSIRLNIANHGELSCKMESRSGTWTITAVKDPGLKREPARSYLLEVLGDLILKVRKQYPDSVLGNSESPLKRHSNDPQVWDRARPFMRTQGNPQIIVPYAAISGDWVVTMIFLGDRKSEFVGNLVWIGTLKSLAP
jgi:hypothetical protein